jgi:hypothetical protein
VKRDQVVASTSTPAPKPGVALPPETVRRWKDIVLKAAVNGHNISNLVQQFAEQAFNNKSAALNNHGARRRSVGSLRKALQNEVDRAQKFLESHGQKGQEALSDPFAGVRIEPRGPQDAKPPPKRRAKQAPLALTRDAAGYKATPMEAPLRSRAAMDLYIKGLTSQLAQVDQELAQIDAILNKGLQGQQSLIDELANTSRELYRIAQETIAAANLPTPPLPEPRVVPGPAPRQTQSGVTELPKPLSEEPTATLSEAPQTLPELQSEVANLLGQIAGNATHAIGQILAVVFKPLDAVFGLAEQAVGRCAITVGTVLVRAQFVGSVLLREALRAVYLVLSTLAR